MQEEEAEVLILEGLQVTIEVQTTQKMEMEHQVQEDLVQELILVGEDKSEKQEL